jgi:hypothetical protein
MSVSYKYCELSGRGLCVGLITRPEESYRVGVSECDREASIMMRPWPTRGCCAIKKIIRITVYMFTTYFGTERHVCIFNRSLVIAI